MGGGREFTRSICAGIRLVPKSFLWIFRGQEQRICACREEEQRNGRKNTEEVREEQRNHESNGRKLFGSSGGEQRNFPCSKKRKQKKTVVNLNVTNVTFNHNATPPSLPTMSADLVLEYKFHNEQLFAIVKSYRSGQRVPRGGLDREAALARDTAHTTRARNN